MLQEIQTGRSSRMDALQVFLEELKRLKVSDHHFLGMLHLLIGRKVTQEDGTPVSNGMSWRELAAVLKKARWNKDTVKKLGIDFEALAPRDRERLWYLAISRAGVDSVAASQDADFLADLLQKHGYVVGPSPTK